MPTDALAPLVARIERTLPVLRSSDVLEREVKVLGADRDWLEGQLLGLGAAMVFSGEVRTARLRVPELPPGCPLKYRVLEGYPPSLILKGRVLAHPRFKLRREIAWDLRGEATPARVAQLLGGTVQRSDVKERRSYTLEGARAFHVDIDLYPEFGLVVEVEGSSDAAIDRAIRALELGSLRLSALPGSQLRRG